MEIPEFYSGSSFFITGATGFVGLCLIEKLLRCIPGIGLIYILLRPKRGRDLQQRLDDLLNDRIFNTLRAQNQGLQLQKVIGIAGDISKDDLDLSVEDECMLTREVNFVIHCAAELNFNEKLKTAVNINLLGTRRVIKLCKKMLNLKVLVHISSAFANADRKSVREILYPLPRTPDEVIDLVESQNDDVINQTAKMILKKCQNAYTFTKALAEREVHAAKEYFLTVIVRPSVITSAWKEPVPGWTNSKNGPQGFIMAAAKGVIRRLPMDKSIIYDYVPVDIVINEIISAAWYVVQQNQSETLILHCTTSTYKPFRWSEIEHKMSKTLYKYPISSVMWYPTLKFVPSMLAYRVSSLIYHMIPAYLIDTLLRLIRQKPALVKLHKKVNKSLDLLSQFIFNEWKFDNTNTLKLHRALPEADQTEFGVDVKDLVWETYFDDLAAGVCVYLINEDISASNTASKRNKYIYLWLLNIILQILIIQVLFVIVYTVSGSTLYTGSIVPLFVVLINSF